MEDANVNPNAQTMSETAEMKMDGWSLAFGIILVIAGVFALMAPVATTLVTNVFVGWFLVFGGIVQFFAAIVKRKEANVWIGMIVGILAFVLGVMMVSHLVASLASLTLFLGVVFLVDGVVKTFQSIVKRPSHWGWMLASGLISILLALLIFFHFFAATLLILGTLVGVYMLFAGIEIIVEYYAMRKV